VGVVILGPDPVGLAGYLRVAAALDESPDVVATYITIL
jgi:hypothetical protein